MGGGGEVMGPGVVVKKWGVTDVSKIQDNLRFDLNVQKNETERAASI